MKIIKLIAGLILGFFSLKTMIEMAGTESGAGLLGAFTGFILLGGLAAWLIYSGIKSERNEE